MVDTDIWAGMVATKGGGAGAKDRLWGSRVLGLFVRFRGL